MGERMTAKQAREESGYSIKEMASELGLGRSTYLRKESGETRFYYDEMMKFSEKVDVDPEDILFCRQDVPENGKKGEEENARLLLKGRGRKNHQG